MAIDRGNIDALHFLGHYYKSIDDYTNMKKYLTIAANNNYMESIETLRNHYSDQEENEKLKKMYNIMVLSNKNNYGLNGNNIKKLEYCMNFPHILQRNKVITNFNVLSCTYLTTKERIIFLQLLKEYIFNDDDMLYTSIKIILDLSQ